MNLLIWVARLAGILGVLVTAFAVLLRVRGLYAFGGYQAGTLLIAGSAAMVLACLAYLATIAERAR